MLQNIQCCRKHAPCDRKWSGPVAPSALLSIAALSICACQQAKRPPMVFTQVDIWSNQKT